MSDFTSTALGGALRRLRGGWHWRSGDAEPRIRDMTLRDVAPNRGGTTYVEIPERWAEARYWPGNKRDEQAETAIRELIREHGQHGTIFNEDLLDDHRITVEGHIVPIQTWDDRMGGTRSTRRTSWPAPQASTNDS